MKRRRILYGWLQCPGRYCLGRNPPDLPTAPYEFFATMSEAERAALDRRSDIIWSGTALAEKQSTNHRRQHR